jgi:hypothetical protein
LEANSVEIESKPLIISSFFFFQPLPFRKKSGVGRSPESFGFRVKIAL